MNEQAPDVDKGDVEFKYDGPLPTSDLISYTKMAMEMNHSAMTNDSCLSLLVMALFGLGVIAVLSVVINSVLFR